MDDLITKAIKEMGPPKRSKEPNILDYIWNKENLNKYRKELVAQQGPEAPFEHKIFFIEPSGTYRQSMDLIQIVTAYILGNVREEIILETIFSQEPPVFRVDCMYEIRTGSGKFEYLCFDLIQEIIEQEDIPFLEDLYPLIDPSDYSDYAEKINELLGLTHLD